MHTNAHIRLCPLPGRALGFQLQWACLFDFHCRLNQVQMLRGADCLTAHMFKHRGEEMCVIIHTHTHAHKGKHIFYMVREHELLLSTAAMRGAFV